MKPASIFICLILFTGAACDDGTDPRPEPEPEPEPTPATALRLLETRTLDGTGTLLFRDEYSYPDGQLDGFRRYGPDGLVTAVFALDVGMDGVPTSMTVSRADTRLFRDEFFASEDHVDGVRRADGDDLFVATYGIDRDEHGATTQIEYTERETGLDVVHRDVYLGPPGDLEAIVRYDGRGRLLAVVDVELDQYGQAAELSVSTPEGVSHIVEFEYGEVAEPPQPLPLIYALTDVDGRDLPSPR